METFALFGAAGFGVLITLFLWAGIVALRIKARNARFNGLVSQLWLIVQATVAHAERELRPSKLVDGKLTTYGAASLKAEVVALVQQMAHQHLGDFVTKLRMPRSALEPMISGLVERAVALQKAAPASPVEPS